MNNYTQAEVEDLLWLLWDPDRYYGPGRDEQEPDGDMPRVKADPTKQGGWMAEMADIRRAWARADLTRPEARYLCFYYGQGRTQLQIGLTEQVDQSTVSRAMTSGLVKLTKAINRGTGRGSWTHYLKRPTLSPWP